MPYHRSIVNFLPPGGIIMIFVLCFSIVAVVTYMLVKRFYPTILEKPMSPAFFLISSTVAFLVGFTITLLWQNYQAALSLSLDEASNFYLLLDNLKVLSPEAQHQILPAIREYLDALNTKEWPALRLGLATSAGWDAFGKLYDTVQMLSVANDGTNDFSHILALLDHITLNRLSRLQTADPLLVIDLFPVILFGGCFIVFALAVNAPNYFYNSVFLALSIFLLSINIGLATVLAYPFSGTYGVKATALRVGIPRKLDQIERANNVRYYQQLVEKKLQAAKKAAEEAAELKDEGVKK